jgi:hypothetical protein
MPELKFWQHQCCRLLLKKAYLTVADISSRTTMSMNGESCVLKDGFTPEAILHFLIFRLIFRYLKTGVLK